MSIDQPSAPAAPLTHKPNILRRLYAWTLHWASTPYGLVALVAIAFLESSFFPIPPDVLLLALCFANPVRWWVYALWCTIASVAGGVLGWVIGVLAWGAVGGLFFSYVPGFTQEKFDLVAGYYNENALLAIIVAGFTPIPYKIFTIASGVFSVDLWTLVLGSIIGRGGRFFLVAGIIRVFGVHVRPVIEKYFEWACLLLGILAVGGFVALKYLH